MFLFSDYFRIALSSFRARFHLFGLEDLKELINLFNMLPDRFTDMTYKRVLLRILIMFTTLFYLFQAREYQIYESIKTCKLHDTLLKWKSVPTKSSIFYKTIVHTDKYVVSKKHRCFFSSFFSALPTKTIAPTTPWWPELDLTLHADL